MCTICTNQQLNSYTSLAHGQCDAYTMVTYSNIHVCMYAGVSIVEEELVEISEKIVKEHFADLIDEFERAGWITNRNLLGPKEWRYQLTYNKSL